MTASRSPVRKPSRAAAPDDGTAGATPAASASVSRSAGRATRAAAATPADAATPAGATTFPAARTPPIAAASDAARTSAEARIAAAVATDTAAAAALPAGMPESPAGVLRGEDGLARCAWCAASPAYRRYHDEEWGFPVTDERRLFEKLCLEGFQAGLSWLTILNKREAFRAAFAGFDAERMAAFGPADVERLLGDAGIVRHRGKIESAVNNARRVLELRAEFGSLAAYVWSFEPPADARPQAPTLESLRAATTSQASTAMSRDLKRRGWSFVGPTTVHAFMQAMGLVNDHLDGCHVRERALAARAALQRPQPPGAG
jgi:DNA-3-methyladenine glycosylase I